MADLTITAANVVASSTAKVEHGTAGATITAGKVVYLDTAATGKWKLADADEDTAIERGSAKVGVALNGASDGQPVTVALEGDITIGATMTAGSAYYLSATPGGICPVADLATGDYYTLLGSAKSTSVLALKPQYTGVAA